jgi:hypothetical protein
MARRRHLPFERWRQLHRLCRDYHRRRLGKAATVLPVHERWGVWDQDNVLDVLVQSPGLEFESHPGLAFTVSEGDVFELSAWHSAGASLNVEAHSET